MDLEAIERALEKCETIDPVEWTESCQLLLMQHGPDLLRLVRAMRWVEENRGAVWYSTYGCFACDWNVDTKTEGATPLAAIEAAMSESK